MTAFDDNVLELLLPYEEILFTARGRTSFFSILPNKIYLTNRRIIFRNPKVFGIKHDYVGLDYRDISQIRLKKGVFSTKIQITSIHLFDEILIPVIEDTDTLKIESYIKKGMRQKLINQKKSLKETYLIIEEIKNNINDPLLQMKKINNLRNLGVMTEEEFKAKKKDLLKKI